MLTIRCKGLMRETSFNIEYANDATVDYLKEILPQKANDYRLEVTNFTKADVIIYTVDDGVMTQAKETDRLIYLEDKYVVFEIRGLCSFGIKHAHSDDTCIVKITRKSTVADLVTTIKNQIDRFGVNPASENLVTEGKAKILIKMEGRTSVNPLTQVYYRDEAQLSSIQTTDLEFVISPNRDNTELINEITRSVCGQNIGLFGLPGHGKSSTANTLCQAVRQTDEELAETFPGLTTGTKKCRYHPVKVGIGNRKFYLVDVPGSCIRREERRPAKQKAVVKYVLTGKARHGKKIPSSPFQRLGSSSHDDKRIHTIVYIHNGSLMESDEMTPGQHSGKTLHSVLSSVRMKYGAGIPMFVILTHADKMDSDEQVANKITKFSSQASIEKRKIFLLANNASLEIGDGQVDREAMDEHTLKILKQLLSAAKIFKNDGVAEVENAT